MIVCVSVNYVAGVCFCLEGGWRELLGVELSSWGLLLLGGRTWEWNGVGSGMTSECYGVMCSMLVAKSNRKQIRDLLAADVKSDLKFDY